MRPATISDMQVLSRHSTLARAHLLLKLTGEEFVPVFEDGRIVGVITVQDIQRAILMREDCPGLPLVVENFMGPCNLQEES